MLTTVNISDEESNDDRSKVREGDNYKLPSNERQARPLIPLKEPEQIQRAWSRALEMSDGSPKEKDVRQAVAELYGSPKRPKKKRTYTEEEKELGVCDWDRSVHEGVPRFDVSLHDPEVATKIERIAAENGRSNAYAIGMCVNTFDEGSKLREDNNDLKEKFNSISALNERLKQEIDKLWNAQQHSNHLKSTKGSIQAV